MLFFLDNFAKLPSGFLYAFSRLLSWIVFYIVRYRRSVVHKNIGLAFPEKTAAERFRIEKGFYRHLADVVVEILMLSRFTPEQLQQRVDIVGFDGVRRYLDNGQSVMLLAAHQGNWEWMLTVVASVIERPFDALYRPLHNREMDNFFMAMRTRFGVNMVAADRAARAIPMLRKQVRALGIIGDQNPRRKDEKYWATFMGIETPVSPGPERIARMTDCPVFYVGMERLKRGKYRCVIDLLAEGPYTVDGELSQEYMSAVEAHIRKQPECWMWSHHRWRYAKSDCLV